QWKDSTLTERWDALLEVRTAVQAALEAQRRDKVIGSSLEADVQLQSNADTYAFLKDYESDLATLFIVSRVRHAQVAQLPHKPDFLVTVSKSASRKCERCWNYRDAVGESTEHPTLCDRCVEAVQ